MSRIESRESGSIKCDDLSLSVVVLGSERSDCGQGRRRRSTNLGRRSNNNSYKSRCQFMAQIEKEESLITHEGVSELAWQEEEEEHLL